MEQLTVKKTKSKPELAKQTHSQLTVKRNDKQANQNLPNKHSQLTVKRNNKQANQNLPNKHQPVLLYIYFQVRCVIYQDI